MTDGRNISQIVLLLNSSKLIRISEQPPKPKEQGNIREKPVIPYMAGEF